MSNEAQNTKPTPTTKWPLIGVAAVFSLSVMCVGMTIQLLPAWEIKQAERTRPMFASNDYQFTRTAVILPGERNARLRQQKRDIITTPAGQDYIPKVHLPTFAPSRSIPFTNHQHKPAEQQIVQKEDKEKTHTTQPRWQTNAHRIDVPEGHAQIAIVIDDMGVAADNSQAVIDHLPKEITLAFLPYGEATMAQAKAAFKRGNDIMIHLPMQPHRKTANPGPHALYADDVTAQLERKIRLNFKDLKNMSVGVNNHMGSKFTESLSGMRTVLEAVDKEHMFFLDSITTGNSATDTARTGLNLPILKRHVFLDHEVTPEFINTALAKAESHAKKHGAAIAIGHPYPATTEAIAAWAPTLAEKNISLVPISNLLQDQ